jgi:hypothetical protein
MSSKYEYATGVASNVSRSESTCPPTTTPAVARLNAEPMPFDVTSGIMPATNAIVVMRIGRSRSLFAWRMASSRGRPLALSWFV